MFNQPSHFTDNTKQFLENFPAQEIWRFFIERKRYDFRAELYKILYRMLGGRPQYEPVYVNISDIENAIKYVKIKHVARIANSTNNTELLYRFNTLFKDNDKGELLIIDVFNKHQGWQGFEEFEPGYLSSVIDGFNLLLKNLLDDKQLDLEFIKLLHQTCTENVKNMLEDHGPGTLRQDGACWLCTRNTDSLQGLIETIDYIKSMETDDQLTGFLFQITDKRTKKKDIINHFKNENTLELAKKIWNMINNDKMEIFIAVNEDKKIDRNAHLTNISNKHLETFHHEIAEAKTKEQKLTAIFTYLKYTVLHHPFQDGVGRTYSMLLLQYLLMRSNLLPGLLTDSNIIPGYSVKELVENYLNAEKDMEKIFKNKQYISSKDFCDNNVDTPILLEKMNDDEKKYFMMCVLKYETASKSFLELKYGNKDEPSQFTLNSRQDRP